MQKEYSQWSSGKSACRAVVIGAATTETLELLDDVKAIAASADWAVLDFLTPYHGIESAPLSEQRKLTEFMRHSRGAANVLLHLSPDDIELHIIVGYFISASVPIITFKQQLPVLWQFAQLHHCEGSLDFKLLLDQYVIYQAPTVLQRLRKASMCAR